ncbi:putative asparagine synthase [Magnetofaba australis IT-1]|uniref:asparagine synthase (glutamine-hydrolyzing) n=2 Tax=Magnetofaba TaxID=1472292 RepID=A0A1Y2K6P0_9PROT|nr:putative asparagine synthase [Magnetofaba australis IT-1]
MGAVIARMRDALIERGPDDAGAWVDAEAGVALGHRRLSILDLSPLGHQPMRSACGDWVLAYNGEIYNHLELRAELESQHGARFVGRSDTETLLAAFVAWGVEATLPRLNGMFAIAAWNRRQRTLTLARDRMGKKPLYYGWAGGRVGGTLLFGSQTKSFAPHSDWSAQIDPDAAAHLLRRAFIPANRSIYRHVAQLPPGHWATVGADGRIQAQTWWRPLEAALAGLADPIDDAAQASALLEETLADAVSARLLSDAPLGAFLSGGVDSSAVAALMRAHGAATPRTFSIGFSDPRYDESVHARAVANHLGTDHTELIVEPDHALELIPQIPEFFDEPFADASQLPTWLLAKMTREQVTVALSGDGGDELFAGYNRHVSAARLQRLHGRLPAPLRALAAWGIERLSPAQWDRLISILPAARRPRLFGEKLYKVADLFHAADAVDIHRRLTAQWSGPLPLVGAFDELAPTPAPLLPGVSLTREMQLRDVMDYLAGDILVKVDRATMATSLEARAPLLDHRVVALSWRFSDAVNAGPQGKGKHPLRQLLYRHVPQELIERPKMGFAIPIGDWLRGPLKGWADSLLDPQRLQREGLLDPAPIQRLWREHQSGRYNRQYPLWNVLMLQAWKARWAP